MSVSEVKIDMSGWEKLKRKLTAVERDAHVKVGVLGDSSDEGDGDMSIVDIAAVHEYGTLDGRVPSRSYMRSALIGRLVELKKLQGNVAVGYVTGRLSLDQALGMIGEWAAAAMRAQITDSNLPPPLQPATVKRKGSDKPLVDTGQLVMAITYEVVK